MKASGRGCNYGLAPHGVRQIEFRLRVALIDEVHGGDELCIAGGLGRVAQFLPTLDRVEVVPAVRHLDRRLQGNETVMDPAQMDASTKPVLTIEPGKPLCVTAARRAQIEWIILGAERDKAADWASAPFGQLLNHTRIVVIHGSPPPRGCQWRKNPVCKTRATL